jgi:hypothetical protein
MPPFDSSLLALLVRPVLVILLAFGTLLQGMSLRDGMIALAAEESKSAPKQENDDESECAIRTLYAASQTCQRRLIHLHGRTTEFVRPLTRSAYAERSAHALANVSIGTGIHEIPLRC